jgi:hypothetical protein
VHILARQALVSFFLKFAWKSKFSINQVFVKKLFPCPSPGAFNLVIFMIPKVIGSRFRVQGSKVI